ncbi:hypothetical protein DFH08DRAFT_103647 [Mycena albidolilacea]|uniref:Uncharacterized protein n=1 Tax=Mycena albidolilacea TaxID=1033008 RepID=A0AAD6YYS7_9AGAR|nr:hypothetical protein DFH08DRAFT_103647 [Mycena albidolilacea]
MSSSLRETDPLLPRVPAAPSRRKPSFVWLIPVVVLASICRGISMFARFEHYQKTFCPVSQPCGSFSKWLELPGITVMIQTWGVWASFIVSFLSVGWWSALGDRRGRKIVLFASILGTAFLDLMYLIVANVSLSPSREDAQDLLSVGLIAEGLLGGFATYNGVVHAYAFDVASTPLSRPVLFGVVDALSFVGFIIGAIIGKLTRYNVSYIFSIFIAIANLAFIYAVLPKSLKQQDGARSVTSQPSVFKSVFSPISVFFRGAGSPKSIPLLGLAFYVFSLTSAMETSVLRWTPSSPFLPGFPRWLLLTTPRILELATLLCIIPGIAWYWQRKYGTTERAGLHLAATLSHNSILVGALSCIAVLVFCIPNTATVLYPIFAPLYPLSVAATPALYALGAAYFVALGRRAEIGSLFGALAIWGELALYMSYSLYGPGEYVFWESAFYLVVALILLLPDPPRSQEEGVSQAGESQVCNA